MPQVLHWPSRAWREKSPISLSDLPPPVPPVLFLHSPTPPARDQAVSCILNFLYPEQLHSSLGANQELNGPWQEGRTGLLRVCAAMLESLMPPTGVLAAGHFCSNRKYTAQDEVNWAGAAPAGCQAWVKRQTRHLSFCPTPEEQKLTPMAVQTRRALVLEERAVRCKCVGNSASSLPRG